MKHSRLEPMNLVTTGVSDLAHDWGTILPPRGTTEREALLSYQLVDVRQRLGVAGDP